MLLDLPDRLIGQVIVDFGNETMLDIAMHHVPQLGKRARWRDYHGGLDIVSAHPLLQHGRNMVGKVLLFELVPIGGIHTAAPRGSGAFEAPSRAIGSLLTGWRIAFAEGALSPQIRVL